MTLSNILQTAYTGIAASQTALRSVSNNISNVNTAGYSREQVMFEAHSYGGNVSGVKIGQIRRVTDQFLEKAVYTAGADVGRYSIMQQFHDRLQAFIGSSDSKTGLSASLGKIFTTLSTLSANTSDSVRRQGAIDSLDRFAGEVEALAAQVQTLRADTSNQIMETVGTVNDLLARIHELNPRIVALKVTNSNASALEEQRAQALEQLSQLMDIRTVDAGNGAVHVVTSSGTTLLDHSLYQLDYPSPGTVVPETNFSQIRLMAVHVGTGVKTDTGKVMDGDLASGKLKGLLDMRDKELPAVAASLGELARAFMEELNAVHNAHSAVPAPATLSGKQTGMLGTDRHGFTGSSTFAVVDQAGRVVASTVVDFDALAGGSINDVIAAINAGLGGAGTASFANGKLQISATGAGNGVVVADDAASPSNRAGKGFSHFFGLNDLISSKYNTNFATGVAGTDSHGFAPGGSVHMEIRDTSNRIIASYTLPMTGGSFNDMLANLNSPAGLGNYMTFSLDARGQLVSTPKPGYSSAQIHVVSDTTSRGDTGVSFNSFFGLDRSSQAKIATSMSVRPDIASNPFNMALARYDGTAGVGDLAIGIGDQHGANALFDISNGKFSFGRAGDIAEVSASLSEYLGLLMGDAAMKAQRSDSGTADAAALFTTVVQRRDDHSGVNLDEELSNMVVFQNSYNAAARLMTTAKEMYDTLLSVAQ